MRTSRAVLLLAALAASACARPLPAPTAPAAMPPSAEASVHAGVNAEYLKPDLDLAPWIERFEHAGREIFDRRGEIVRATGARPGAVVADVGAGTGLFTTLLADAVGPGGRVYAEDIVPNSSPTSTRRSGKRTSPMSRPCWGRTAPCRCPRPRST